MGELVVDDSWRSAELDLKFWAPRPDDTPAAQAEPTDEDRVFQGVQSVIAKGYVANLGYVRAECAGIRAVRVDDALARLVLNGRLVEKAGARGARIFTLSQDHPASSTGGTS